MNASVRFPVQQGPVRGPWQSSTSPLTGVGEPARQKYTLWVASLWAQPLLLSVFHSMGAQRCITQAVAAWMTTCCPLLSGLVPQ